MVVSGEEKGTERKHIKGIEFIASIFMVNLKPFGALLHPFPMTYGPLLIFLPSPFPSASHLSPTLSHSVPSSVTHVLVRQPNLWLDRLVFQNSGP